MTYRLARPYADQELNRRATWVASMLNAAPLTARRIGCSPEAIVAQAALETGWGRSAIGNNVFGIKADRGWRGLVARDVPTWENIGGNVVYIRADFRDYATLEEGIADHFDFLHRNGRYAAAGVFDPDDTKSDHDYFAALARAGYATDPDYASKLDAMLQSVEIVKTRLANDNAPPPPPSPRILSLGDKGPDVEALQRQLASLGLAVGIIDGDFGPKTHRAVTTFQKANGLEADGWVGDKTRAALAALAH